MSAVLLVRHGQASWGALRDGSFLASSGTTADYDLLSATGEEQSRVLGAALAARRVVPDLVVHGAMKRQRETARLVVEGTGWTETAEEDPSWDEMDHLEVLARQPRTFEGAAPTAREFQAWFEAATQRWTHGGYDDDYAEPFPAFSARVTGGLERITSGLGADATAVVVTSGGPIARLVADLLGGGADLHRRLAPVVVNASVTKVVVGRRGTTLVSFNDHSHLEAAGADLITYR